MNRNLESLLRWSIENQGPAAGNNDETTPQAASSSSQQPRDISQLDPGVIDAILGKSDAQRMLECVRDLKSDQFNLEQKLNIWDELELLVESLDNANDLENMKLWEPIYSFLSDPEEEMRLQACWVLGTAIQNNPRSQTAFLNLDPLPKLLELLTSETSSEIRSKTMYTLSGALRHHPPAVDRFTELDGWSVFDACLQDPSIPLRRKTAFLINSLFVNSVSEAEASKYAEAAQKADVLDTLLDSLRKNSAIPGGENGEVEEIDEDYSDKATQTLLTVVDKAGIDKFKPEQKTKLRDLVGELTKDNRIPADIAKEEWDQFVNALDA